MIMYGFRPALTVVAFRCIEQIVHHFGHGLHHDGGHAHDTDNIHNFAGHNIHSIQAAPSDAHTDLIDAIDREEEEDDNIGYLEFHPITVLELIILAPLVMSLVVFDLVTLSDDNSDYASKVDFVCWGSIFFVKATWSIYISSVIYKYNKEHGVIIDKQHAFAKQSALLVSSIGLIIALIGSMGKNNRNWAVIVAYSIDIVYVIGQFLSLSLLNESKVEKDKFDAMGWKVKTYGKVVIVLHVTLIIHGFLFEGYHLEETMDTTIDQDRSNFFGALEFIFFFWSIEFHLACIERIKLSEK